MTDPAAEPWGLVLILGPILLLAAFVFVWWSNRKALPRDARGDSDTGAAVGATNAVRGSDKARPDIEAEAARAESGAEAGDDPAR